MKQKENPCFIDIHCHLDMIELPIDRVIENAAAKDVKIILAQGVNPHSNRKVLEIAGKFSCVKACLGLYPIDALKLSDKEIDEEIDFIRSNANKISAIGEVGLDFKEDLSQHEKQMKTFEKIIKLSIDINKPIIVHSRKAENECIELLGKNGARKVIMHCFSGKFSLIEKIAKMGWYLTVPTSAKNSEHFQKMVKNTDMNLLLCETDSPYLHPDKKWPNEPCNVVASYEKIAEIKGITLADAKKKIFENYQRLFSKIIMSRNLTDL